MKKKLTMLLAALLACVGTMRADNVLFNRSSSTALPGTNTDGQYHWKSSEITAPDDFKTLRLTFTHTTNEAKEGGGHPHVAIAEFYLYDKDGNLVTLTTENFSSNATEAYEGQSGLQRLCDGSTVKFGDLDDNSWYWHSSWSSNAGAFHYLEINVSDITADLSTFAIGYVTRRADGSPTEILVTTGSSTEDVNAQCPNVTVTYNHMFGGVNQKTEQCPALVGASYPSYSLPWGVKTETALPTTVTSDATTINLDIQYNGELPFTPSTSFEEANWYYLSLNNNKQYIRYDANDTSIPMGITSLYPATDLNMYAWAFVGSPYEGYRLINRKAGSDKILSSSRNVYDGNTGGSTYPLVKAEEDINESTDNKTWIIEKSSNIENGMFIGLTTSQNANVFMNDRGKLAFWTGGRGAGSTFTVKEFKYKPGFEIAKAEALKNLTALAKASAICTQQEVETAQTTISALNPGDSDEEVFSALQTLNDCMNSLVEGKYFTINNMSDNSRYLTTDGGYAVSTTTVDIHAYWTLKNINGMFRMYNQYNNAYLQAVPNSNNTKISTTTDENIAACYKAILPTDADNVWAFTSFENANATSQIFLHKDGSNNIVRWDANSSTKASHWTIDQVDYAAAFSALIEAQLEGKVFNDIPGLGEYPTSAKNEFDAQKEAYIANPTEENEIALVNSIDKLEAALNRPVYIITSAMGEGSYADGKAILYNGSAWRFEKTNIYDSRMWMTIPSHAATSELPTVKEFDTNGVFYEICDYPTGHVMRDRKVQIVEIEGWDGVYNLQYSTGVTNDGAQHAQDGGALVGWNPATTTDSKASAWKVEYIGNTYLLDQFTEEQLHALSTLQAEYASKQHLLGYQFGNGVGEYPGDADLIASTLHDIEAIFNVPFTEQRNTDINQLNTLVQNITAIEASPKLNMPADGRYYRIKRTSVSGNTPVERYITGTTTDDGKIALSADADASTIYYYTKQKLQAYQSGKFIGLNKDHWTFADDTHPATVIKFAASPRTIGAYTIFSDTTTVPEVLGRYFHDSESFLNRCDQDASHAEHDWTLEEVKKENITYIYKSGEQEIYRETVTEFAGMPYPTPKKVPFGFTVPTDALTGTITAGKTEKVIACNTSTLPFKYAESYASITDWYYLSIRGTYMYYDSTVEYIKASENDVPANSKEAYSWAFVGNPVDGFSIVNKLAGETMILSSPEAPTAYKNAAQLARMVVEESATGNRTWKFMTPINPTVKGSFYVEHPKNALYALNRQDYNNVNTACYWDGRDLGSEIKPVIINDVHDLNDLVVSNAYTLQAERSPLMYSATEGMTTKLSSGMVDGVEPDHTDANQQFLFLRTENTLEGQYYLYSIGAKKFVGADLAFTDTPTDAVLTFENRSTTVYPWFVKIDNKYVVPGDGGTVGNKINHVESASDDDGKHYNITDAGAYDEEEVAALLAQIEAVESNIKAELEPLIAKAQARVQLVAEANKDALNTAITEAQEVYENPSATYQDVVKQMTLLAEAIATASLVSSVEEFNNEGVYTFISNRSETSYMMYDSSAPEYVASQYMKTNLEVGDDLSNCQWAVYKSETGHYYMYNLGAQKFMGKEDRNQTSIPFAETPQTQDLKFRISSVDTHPIIISANNGNGSVHHSNQTFNGSNPSGIMNWQSTAGQWAAGFEHLTDDGNVHKVSIVDQLTEEQLGTISGLVKKYEQDFALASLNAAIAAAQAKLDDMGNAPGYYSSSKENPTAELDAIKTFRDEITEATTIEAIENETEKAEAITASFSVNLPKTGKFYRIKNNSATGYLDATGTSGVTLFTADIEGTANSIFYLDGDKLLSYVTGTYLAGIIPSNKQANFLCYTETVGAEAGTTISFVESPVAGKLLITFDNGSRSFYSDGTGGSNAAGSGNNGDNYRFTVEEVTTLPVTVTNAQMTFADEDKFISTLFAPVALEVPEGTTAYIGMIEDNYLAMEAIEDIIPANTGVILMADEAKTYDFTVSSETGTLIGDEDNIITGSVAKTIVTPEANTTCYVLAKGDSGVGLYKATLNKNENTGFLNNACKVYIPVPVAEPQAARALVMRFGRGEGGTTAIEPAANGQQTTAIYDLQGRRVLNPTKGMYIVNGKKVIF